VAFALPPTYIFEAARSQLSQGHFAWSGMGWATLLNLAYFGLAVLIFAGLFRRSRRTGQFARNDI
jgi:hypothetical protein